MPAKHENYPAWFSGYYPPMKVSEPSKKIISRRGVGSAVNIEDGCEIDHEKIFQKGKRYVLEVERGYDGDLTSYAIQEIVEEEIDSPYYKNNLAAYEDHQKKIKEWTELKKRWDKEEEEWQTELEKQTLAKLKAKYENG